MYIISGKKYVSSRLHASYLFPFLPIEGKFLVKRKKNKAVKIYGNCNSSMYAQIIIRFNLNLNHANPTNFFSGTKLRSCYMSMRYMKVIFYSINLVLSKKKKRWMSLPWLVHIRFKVKRMSKLVK